MSWQMHTNICAKCQRGVAGFVKYRPGWLCNRCEGAAVATKHSNLPKAPDHMAFVGAQKRVAPAAPGQRTESEDTAEQQEPLPESQVVASLLSFEQEAQKCRPAEFQQPSTRQVRMPNPNPSEPALLVEADVGGCSPLPAAQENLTSGHFSLWHKAGAIKPHKDIWACLQNQRSGRVDFNRPALRPRTENGKKNKELLQAASSQREALDLIRERNLQVRDMYRKTGSISASLGHFAVWRQFCLEVMSVCPYRWCWALRDKLPAATQAEEDGLMEWFATYLSIRYDTIEAVEQAVAAVTVFHGTVLKLPRPPMPITARFVKNLRKVMRLEVPVRASRHTLEPRHIDGIVRFIQREMGSTISPRRKAYLANLIALIAAAATAGFRVGELAVGKDFEPQPQSGFQCHWTRLSLAACLRVTEPGDTVQIPPPLRKMEGASRLSRERSRQAFPFLFDPQLPYNFCHLVRELFKVDPVDQDLLGQTPAFRDPCLPGAPALDAKRVCFELRRAFECVFAEEQSLLALTIGDQSLRKAANVAAQAAGASADQCMAWYGWLGPSKRLYDESILAQLVDIQKTAPRADFGAMSALSSMQTSHDQPQRIPTGQAWSKMRKAG